MYIASSFIKFGQLVSPVDGKNSFRFHQLKNIINLNWDNYLTHYLNKRVTLWVYICLFYTIDALLKSLGLQLVGPFDILSGKYKRKRNKRGMWPNFLLHWRYFYDPPEFMTVIKGDDEKEFHLGYFRLRLYFEIWFMMKTCYIGWSSVRRAEVWEFLPLPYHRHLKNVTWCFPAWHSTL